MNLIAEPSAESAQRVVIYGVDWNTYEKFLDAIGERPVRLTYDGENLEIMTLSWDHEWLKRRIGFMVPFLAAQLDLDIQGGGSTTFRSKRARRGLEPDECFYLGKNAQKMSGPHHDIDLRRDPPPDLAIEVDISSHALDRPEIYAKLGVPELWIAEAGTLQAHRLMPDGTYKPKDRSAWFPTVALDRLLAFVLETARVSESRLIPLAQKWAQENVKPPAKGKSRRHE